MPSLRPPPLTPSTPSFPLYTPMTGKSMLSTLASESYIPISYDRGILKIDIRVGPSCQIIPDIQTLTQQVMNDYPRAPIEISLWDWVPSRDDATSLIARGAAQALSSHFQLLYGVLWRWRSVWFDLKLIEAILFHLTGGDPSLVPRCPERLMLESVHFRGAGDIKDVKLVNEFFRETMGGQMRSLYLDASDSVKPFSIRRSLRCIPYHVLTRVELRDFSVSALEIHELLLKAISIMECVVSDLTAPFPDAGCKAVMPNLRRLKLDVDESDFDRTKNTGAVFRLLAGIAAPDLLELSLGYENIWDDGRFVEFYALCRPRLRKLHLRKMNLNERQLYECLDRHPELEELVLDMQQDHWNRGPVPLLLTQKMCKELSFDKNDESLLPNLERLFVRDNCIEGVGCLSKMVKNRVKNRSLSELVIYGNVLCAEDRKVLNSLAARGMRVAIGKQGYCSD